MKPHEAEFLADLEAERQEIRAETARLRKGANEVVNCGVDAVWSRIEKSASNLVEKSAASLTQEQAVAKYLTTPEGKADYQRYTEASAQRHEVLEKSRDAVAERDLAKMCHDKIGELIEKGLASGMSTVDAVDWARDRAPEAFDFTERGWRK
jgi:hypothetical protein